ncbi:hypothetical protein FACS1894152_1910 [Bacilli bacterium]|nr:hypothetical protein FACS1894152_1910 [Bacilli bacterium]
MKGCYLAVALLLLPGRPCQGGINFYANTVLNTNNIVNYGATIGFYYRYAFNSGNFDIGANTAFDYINNKFFQKNAIEPLANRKKPIELNDKYQHFYNVLLKCQFKINDDNELLANFSYHDIIRYDRALIFSSYNDMFKSMNFGLAYGRVHRKLKIYARLDYTLRENTFKNSMKLGIDGHYGLGRNTLLLFSYDYKFDLEKTDYNGISKGKSGDNIINLLHDNRVYGVPTKSLLDNYHSFSLSNLFQIDKAIQAKLGVKYSIYENTGNGYSLILDILF